MKNNLSMNLVYYKRVRKMTNKTLAEATGLPEGTISRIASGQTKEPTVKTLRLLAQALKCTINDLQADENVENSNKYELLNENEKILLRLFNNLNDDIQKSIITLLMSINKKGGVNEK